MHLVYLCGACAVHSKLAALHRCLAHLLRPQQTWLRWRSPLNTSAHMPACARAKCFVHFLGIQLACQLLLRAAPRVRVPASGLVVASTRGLRYHLALTAEMLRICVQRSGRSPGGAGCWFSAAWTNQKPIAVAIRPCDDVAAFAGCEQDERSHNGSVRADQQRQLYVVPRIRLLSRLTRARDDVMTALCAPLPKTAVDCSQKV